MNLRKAAKIGLALILLGIVGVACSGGQQEKFPAFVYASALSLESYRAATSLPQEVLTSVPCYCGCATAPEPHMSLLDCFYNRDGSYSDHAAGCDLCGKILLDAQAAHQGGKDLKAIRAIIDSKYAVYGTPTDTPPVE
ncbi:MAG: PCYCGC motif-containing (lipo)protein [Dehalococcoidia bacterium]|nr:PCYCGC motif-containing (lipo)protein [Dehalococcoidia bacterium]